VPRAGFTYLLWQLCNGERVAGVKGRPGVAWMHAFRDVFAGIHEAKAGRMSLLDYVRSLRASTEFAAFAWDDPVPGLIDVPLLASRMVMRRLLSLIRRSTRGMFGRERVAEAN